jgi:hypothetical protein
MTIINHPDAYNKEVSQGKLGPGGWAMVAEKLPETVLKFLLFAQAMGGTEQSPHTTALPCCGEDAYLVVRAHMLKDTALKLVKKIKEPAVETIEADTKGKKQDKPAKPAKPAKPTKSSKQEIIIQQNKSDKLEKEFTRLFELLLVDVRGGTDGRVGYNSVYTEFRLIALMAGMRKLTKLESSQITDVVRARVYDTIVGAEKICARLTRDTVSGVSTTAISDVRYWLDKLKACVKFTPRVAMIEYGNSILMTHLDTLIPQLAFKLHASQVQLLQAIKDHPQVMIRYITMNGSGKTVSIVPLIAHIMESNRGLIHNKRYQKRKVLFCCPSKIVRISVARYCYALGIPFAVLSVTDSKARYDYNAFVPVVPHTVGPNGKPAHDDNACILYIADPFMTHHVLQTRATEDMLLFLDEPTMGSDQPGSIMTDYFVKIMTVAPSQTILASATMPELSDMPGFYTQNAPKYPLLQIITINSHEAAIGCKLYELDARVLTPHEGCISTHELSAVADAIESNPFLARFYPTDTVWHMSDRMDDLGTNGPDVDDFFDDPMNWNQGRIQQISRMVLDSIVATDDTTVKEFCITTPSSAGSSKVNLDIVFTTDAHKYIGGCLIACSDPYVVAMELGDKADLFAATNYKTIMKQYIQNMQAYERSKDLITSTVDNPEQQSQRLAALAEKFPQWKLPIKCQINTVDSLRQGHSELVGKARQPIIASDMPDNSKVNDQVLALLACGVGIYSGDSQYLDPEYLEAVIKLASANKLAFIVCDARMAYGANISIHSIIVLDHQPECIVSQNSLKTMYQLLGRSGRKNMSNASFVHVTGNALVNKIRAHLNGTLDDGVHDEAKNIRDAIERHAGSTQWE